MGPESDEHGRSGDEHRRKQGVAHPPMGKAVPVVKSEQPGEPVQVRCHRAGRREDPGPAGWSALGEGRADGKASEGMAEDGGHG